LTPQSRTTFPESPLPMASKPALNSSIGKRWFGVRNSAGTVVSLAALVVLEGVGYLDNVVTFPEARGQGYASAVTARAIAEARTSGAEHVWLLAEPADAPVLRLYERLGFREVGKLAATRGPIDALV